MRATVRKWGNSLALRIPSGMAEDARLQDGTEVEVALHGGRLVVEPVAELDTTLDTLVTGITPENLHGVQFDDGSRGTEVW
jgi:antitoxin MazE